MFRSVVYDGQLLYDGELKDKYGHQNIRTFEIEIVQQLELLLGGVFTHDWAFKTCIPYLSGGIKEHIRSHTVDS